MKRIDSLVVKYRRTRHPSVERNSRGYPKTVAYRSKMLTNCTSCQMIGEAYCHLQQNADKTSPHIESGRNVKIFSKNLTLGGHTFQHGQRGSEVLKRVLSSDFGLQNHEIGSA